jgi:flagellar protein FliO/FliZ
MRDAGATPLTARLGAALLLLACSGLALAADNGASSAPVTSLWEPAIRMVASLAAVLALLAGVAWLARRLRQGGTFRTGLIEVVSGISLGGREKVVLLRVSGEEVLVGISPAGMRALHVLNRSPEQPKSFGKYMEQPQ